MANTVSASEVQKNCGVCHDRAPSEPVRAIASADLTDSELAAIEAAEIPPAFCYQLDP